MLYQRPYETRSCKCRIVDRPIKSLVRPHSTGGPSRDGEGKREPVTARNGEGRSLEGTIGNAPCRKCLDFASFSFSFLVFPFSLDSRSASCSKTQGRLVGGNDNNYCPGVPNDRSTISDLPVRSSRSPLFLVGTQLYHPGPGPERFQHPAGQKEHNGWHIHNFTFNTRCTLC